MSAHVAAQAVVNHQSTADNWTLIGAGVAFAVITYYITHAVADVWDTWLGSARRCGCDKTAPKLTLATPLATVLHGQPIDVGAWVMLNRPGRPVREGEFRGINANTGQIRVRLWSPTLGRFTERREYCDPAFVSSVSAALHPSMLGTGRLAQHRAEHPAAVAS